MKIVTKAALIVVVLVVVCAELVAMLVGAALAVTFVVVGISRSGGSNEVFVFYCSGVGNDDPDFHSGNICRTTTSP